MEPTKANPSIVREAATNTNTIIQKIKDYLPSILLAVVIATAFFIHEAFPLMPENYYKAEAKWETAKVKNTEILNSLKQLNVELYQGKITLDEFYAKQPTLMKGYEQINKEKNELYNRLELTESEARFLQFDSIQFFLGELGWALGLLLYALVNLLSIFYIRARFGKQEFTGKLLLHSTLLFVGCFYTFYVFYSEDDFAREWYMAAMIICTLSLVAASKLISDSYMRKAIAMRKSMETELEGKRKMVEEIEGKILQKFEEIANRAW